MTRKRAHLVKVIDRVTTRARLVGWVTSPDDLLAKYDAGQQPVITHRNVDACKSELEAGGAAEVEIR